MRPLRFLLAGIWLLLAVTKALGIQETASALSASTGAAPTVGAALAWFLVATEAGLAGYVLVGGRMPFLASLAVAIAYAAAALLWHPATRCACFGPFTRTSTSARLFVACTLCFLSSALLSFNAKTSEAHDA
jgi:hypothetical protein